MNLPTNFPAKETAKEKAQAKRDADQLAALNASSANAGNRDQFPNPQVATNYDQAAVLDPQIATKYDQAAALNAQIESNHLDVPSEATPSSPYPYPNPNPATYQAPVTSNFPSQSPSPNGPIPTHNVAFAGDHVVFNTADGHQLAAFVTLVPKSQSTEQPQKLCLTLFTYKETQYRDDVPFGNTPGCWEWPANGLGVGGQPNLF